MKQETKYVPLARLQHRPWRLLACALAVSSLVGCSTVSEKWSQWRGKGGAVPVVAPAAPMGLKPSTETARWLGVYSQQAESGRFQDCQSGQTVPVLMEGDNALLENAYMVAGSAPAAGMLATVDGRMVERPASDLVLAQQGKKELALRVERFVSLSSATSCAGDKAKGLGVPVAAAAAGAAAVGITAQTDPARAAVPAAHAPKAPVATAASTLGNTYWKLLSLNGKAVPRLDKEAHIILQSQGKLVGLGGCNRLMGSWKQDGPRLHIDRVAGTRMACKGAAASTEAAMLKMLEHVASWRVHGAQLELLDAKGKLLAQWQAVALR